MITLRPYQVKAVKVCRPSPGAGSSAKTKSIINRDGAANIDEWLERKRLEFLARGNPPA